MSLLSQGFPMLKKKKQRRVFLVDPNRKREECAELGGPLEAQKLFLRWIACSGELYRFLPLHIGIYTSSLNSLTELYREQDDLGLEMTLFEPL